MERTIRVTGTGNLSIKPDLTIISMEISGWRTTYEETLELSTIYVSLVKDALERAGLKRDSLKTTYFNIGAHYEYYYDEKSNRRSKFNGYEFNQNLKFEFDIDNKMLGRILYQLSKLEINPEFSIHYGVKDTESAKNKLLASAIKDAKDKAMVIASAANVELGEILDINYSWLNVEFTSRPYNLLQAKCLERPSLSGSIDVDIDPEDIERSDNVTLIFKIN